MVAFLKNYNERDTMSDGNDKILEKLGELSGLMIATREDVKHVSNTQKEHGSSIQELTTSIKLMQSCVADNQKDIVEVNTKLDRDFKKINALESDKTVAQGINQYKESKRAWWQWALGIMSVCIGILIGVNQLYEFSQKISISKNKDIAAAYATPLNTKDTLKDTIKTFTVRTDTIKGK